MREVMGNNDALADADKTFFYPNTMLSAGSEHAGIYHDIIKARTQADSMTKDCVLASKISEQILGVYCPSIINYEEGGLRIC